MTEEKQIDYRSVIYAIEHILLGYKNDISPNLRAKLNHWKNNIQEELDKEITGIDAEEEITKE